MPRPDQPLPDDLDFGRHLGTRGCNADALLDFLKFTESEYLYLVGDIIDGWRLRKSWYWAQSHNDVIQKVLRKARKGTRSSTSGQPRRVLRDYVEHQFGGIALVTDAIHVTADGKRLLVLHGDAYDGVVRHARWLAVLGDWAYNLMLAINYWFNVARRRLGYPYWSLSAYLKARSRARSSMSAASRARSPTRRPSAASTAWCAATSTRPRSADERRAVLQRRRLGGELHRPGRAFRRPARDRALGGEAPASPGLVARRAAAGDGYGR